MRAQWRLQAGRNARQYGEERSVASMSECFCAGEPMRLSANGIQWRCMSSRGCVDGAIAVWSRKATILEFLCDWEMSATEGKTTTAARHGIIVDQGGGVGCGLGQGPAQPKRRLRPRG